MCIRAIGSLLTRRFSPRAAVARGSLPTSLQRHGAVVTAVAMATGTFTILSYCKKGVDDESAAKKEASHRKPPPCNQKFITDEACDGKAARHDSEKQDIEARFEDWMKKYGKTYRDEEEKAMRFQLFKNTVEWYESQPPSAQKKMEINHFADFTDSEHPARQSGVDLDSKEYRDHIKELRAKQAKGESLAAWYGGEM